MPNRTESVPNGAESVPNGDYADLLPQSVSRGEGVGKGRIILCDASSNQPGTTPYHIGYIEMVDGYRHAYLAPVGKYGHRTELRYSRSANHPADPRCPECHG